MSNKEREYVEITPSDVGLSTFYAFGRHWPVADFIGAITDVDVGKRVYRTSKHVVSVENAKQFEARLAAEVRSSGSEDSNAVRLANLIYELLSRKSGLDNAHSKGPNNRDARYIVSVFSYIDMVRPPNPAHGHAVAVLFADGKDVVIRFEEQGGK